MHELSIASEMLQTVLAAAAEHNAGRVEAVRVEVGVMRLVVPEILQMAWEAITEGTPAGGSRLEVTEVPLRGRCRECGSDFQPQLDNFLCPHCGHADVDIVDGSDIVLRSVTCRSEGGASAR